MTVRMWNVKSRKCAQVIDGTTRASSPRVSLGVHSLARVSCDIGNNVDIRTSPHTPSFANDVCSHFVNLKLLGVVTDFMSLYQRTCP